MATRPDNHYRDIINALVILGALAAGFLLLRPFFTALAFAAVIAFILFRPHVWLREKVGENISAGLITATVIIVLVAVTILGAQALLNEFTRIFNLLGRFSLSAFFPGAPAEIVQSLEEITRLIIARGVEALSGFISTLPRIIISIFIFSVSVFFFLRDGENLYKWIAKVFPLPAKKKEHMFRDLKRYANSFIAVWFLIGLAQGAVAAIGFMIFGLPAPLLAGIFAAIFSILPVLGPGTLYIPTAALLYLRGDIPTAIGIAAYGLIIGTLLDYVVRPYFAGKWSAIHPLVILVGTIGGILVLGPAGFIVGPAALVVIISILHGAGLGFANNGNSDKRLK